MNTNRACGCKGHRSCVVCEQEFGIQQKWSSDIESSNNLIYYDKKNSWELKKLYHFEGIYIIEEFITEEEEKALVTALDEMPWDKSQSGRRKQNFGPKANFKKRKTKLGNFAGFPATTQFIQERFKEVPLLQSYKTVEQCSIEYLPETGACIEPHVDDCWIWGERIVQLNLLQPTYLTFTPYRGQDTKYNLADVQSYPRVIVDNAVAFDPFLSGDAIVGGSSYSVCNNQLQDLPNDLAIKVEMPPRSLLVLYGPARYDWEHCVLRNDIAARRVVIAYRELTPPYLPGGDQQQLGAQILEAAQQFWDHRSDTGNTKDVNDEET